MERQSNGSRAEMRRKSGGSQTAITGAFVSLLLYSHQQLSPKQRWLSEAFRSDHPFEQWYETYLATISQEAAAKTANENASQYMIKQQIKALQAQLLELEKRVEK